MKLHALILIFLAVRGDAENNLDDNEEEFDPIANIPLVTEHPCHDSSDIVTWFDPGLPPREKNRYYVLMNRYFAVGSILNLSFDSDVNVFHSLGGVSLYFIFALTLVQDFFERKLSTLCQNGTSYYFNILHIIFNILFFM